MSKLCQFCECDHAEIGPCPRQQAIDDYNEYDDTEECGQCDGDGYWYSCIDGCCVNAEEGCNLCARRCDFCNPFTPKQVQEKAELGQILADALAKKKAE